MTRSHFGASIVRSASKVHIPFRCWRSSPWWLIATVCQSLLPCTAATTHYSRRSSFLEPCSTWFQSCVAMQRPKPKSKKSKQKRTATKKSVTGASHAQPPAVPGFGAAGGAGASSSGAQAVPVWPMVQCNSGKCSDPPAVAKWSRMRSKQSVCQVSHAHERRCRRP